MPDAPEPSCVLHLSTWDVPCGIAGYCANLVAALGRRGIGHDIFPLPSGSWKWFLPSDIRELEDKILDRAKRVDLVHIQHEHSFFGPANRVRSSARNYGRILSRIVRAGVPVVTTFHTEPYSVKCRRGLASAIDRIDSFRYGITWRSRVGWPIATAWGQATALVHTPATRHVLVRSGIPESSVRVVPLGCMQQRIHRYDQAEAKQMLGISPHEKLITIFGFIGAYKGHDLAVHALKHLPDDYRLAICGGTHPEAKDDFFGGLLDLISALGLHDRVKITGWLATEKAELFYAATDVCLAPYRDVGGGRLSASAAVTWALSSGRPIVASKIDAFQAIQREMPCMLMTTPEQPQEIAWAVERLVADRPTAIRFVEAAGAYCDNHSWDTVAEQTVAVYRETMAAARKRAHRPLAL